MKKVILSLAGALAATAFAPEASAIPAFARQVGMACQACHFQHFPLLNSFGRAFKSSGFTMIGAQGKVEDEHLSIPAQLNLSALTTIGYQKQSNNINAANQYLLPVSGGELSLFFGGRISDFAGFLTEVGMTNPGGSAAAGAAKLPLLWDIGGARIGLVAASGGPGPAYSFELLNTGAADTHRLMSSRGANEEHFAASSAFGYMHTNKLTSMGASLVVTGDMGFVNIGKYAVNGATAIATAPNTNQMNTTYARGVYMANAGGWDSAVGIQNFSGLDGTAAAGLDTKATFIDGQMQGEAGGMPLGLYASYGRAPGSVAGNVFNGNAAGVNNTDRKSFNIAAELGVIPHKATLQLALRSANTGTAVATPVADKDNAIMIGGTYELAQNVELLLHHTSQSGSSWNIGGTNNPAGIAAAGKTMTSLILEALF